VISSGALGYWIGEPFARQGHMSEAVHTLLPFAFNTLNLHRLEAACLPQNQASVALLQKSGFLQEGKAKKYLRINGVWRDHLLFALLEEEYYKAFPKKCGTVF
jgi:ribosomal-protein-alanine N-acetyltransferase